MFAGPQYLVVAIALLAAGCSPAENRTVPAYDTFTGRLIQLSADQNGDGKVDQWTYLDGTRVLRGEADADGDSRIDRWEYFDAASRLVMVGTSSRNDGIEDSWAMVEAANGEHRVDLSTARDRRIDRHEYYVNNTLSRIEVDTNADGRIDRWDAYQNATLRQVQFDTSLHAARPNRRLLYDPQGRFLAAEGDDDGDGTFERPVTGVTAPPLGEARK